MPKVKLSPFDLAAWRAAKGFTVLDVANLLGKTERTVARWSAAGIVPDTCINILTAGALPPVPRRHAGAPTADEAFAKLYTDNPRLLSDAGRTLWPPHSIPAGAYYWDRHGQPLIKDLEASAWVLRRSNGRGFEPLATSSRRKRYLPAWQDGTYAGWWKPRWSAEPRQSAKEPTAAEIAAAHVDALKSSLTNSSESLI